MNKKQLQQKVDDYNWELAEMSSNGVYRNVTEREVAKFLDQLKYWISELGEKK